MELKIKHISTNTLKKVRRSSKLFEQFVHANPGFIDDITLGVINRNKMHPDYDDLYNVAMYGVFKAMKSFNSDRAKFSTFAYTVARNEVRQELKRLNKQRNVIKRKDGEGYDHHEISMQALMQNAGEASEFNEMLFKETNHVAMHRNFEEALCDQISINSTFQEFTPIAQKIMTLHYQEGKSIKEVAKILKYNYHTLRILFYHHIRPEIKERFAKCYEA